MKVKQSQYNEKDYKRIFNISVVLSFVVATFAIVSLIAVGFNQVSYAADDEETIEENLWEFHRRGAYIIGSDTVRTIGSNSHTSYEDCTDFSCISPRAIGNGEYETAQRSGDKMTTDEFATAVAKWENAEYTHYDRFTLNETNIFPASFYLEGDLRGKTEGSCNEDGTTDETHETCQYDRSVYQGYKETENYNDLGALYIKENNPNSSEVFAGIAYYLYQNDNDGTFLQSLNEILNYEYIYVFDINNNRIYDQTIARDEIIKMINLVKEARNASLTLSNENDDLVDSVDEDYFETSLFTVNSSISLAKYSINIEGIDGVFAVDADGNIIEDISNVDPEIGSFKLRIPKDLEISQIGQLKVSVSATPQTQLSVYTREVNPTKFVSESQDIKNSSITTNTISYETLLTEDTGIHSSYLKYILGALVMLSGIGLAYAITELSKKDKKQVQQ